MAQMWPRKLVWESSTATTKEANNGVVHVGILTPPSLRYSRFESAAALEGNWLSRQDYSLEIGIGAKCFDGFRTQEQKDPDAVYSVRLYHTNQKSIPSPDLAPSTAVLRRMINFSIRIYNPPGNVESAK